MSDKTQRKPLKYCLYNGLKAAEVTLGIGILSSNRSLHLGLV